MKRFFVFTIFVAAFIATKAQSILVGPYIQNTDTSSVHIVWETDSGTESNVFWGTTISLGGSATGTTTSGITTAIVHDVFLTGLQPNTRYFYKVATGTAQSDTFSLRTLPLVSTNPVVHIVSISDCQYDAAQPTKLSEMVNDGIIDYYTTRYGVPDIEDILDLCLLVGDNVNSGPTISQWRSEFFPNVQNMGSHVALLPVIGNHEANSSNYFAYFSLPSNGPSGYVEHTYYKDVSNTRIIGFDSNTGYQTTTQLDWLSTTLNQAAADTSLNFVIFMEHHPLLSELWLAGETSFAGMVLDSLAKFNQTCGKPVVFLFGHTHAYSRGQMQDAKVLQINTATASGYIDTWGSTPQADYTDFNMSFDEYGFTTFEISSGSNPEMIVRRLTRGDASTTVDNVLQDSIVLRPGQKTVANPTCVFPIDSLPVNPECVTLTITPYSVLGTDSVGAVEYWLATDNAFSNIVYSRWKHTENWYFDVNTLAGDTIYKETVANLSSNQTYYWKARYRTKNLDWSNWSATGVFVTGLSSSSGNLLQNPGAENDVNNWVVETGILESLTSGECAGTSPHSGTYYFGIGGLCTESAFARAHQDVDVSSYANVIDSGVCVASWGGWMSDYAGNDIPAIQISFLDGNLQPIDSTGFTQTNSSSWLNFTQSDGVPPQTRTIRFTMTGTRNSGTDNDSYIDDLFLNVSTQQVSCNQYLIPTVIAEEQASGIRLYPVPAKDELFVETNELYSGALLSVYSLHGQLVKQVRIVSEKQPLNCEELPSGLYFISVSKSNLPDLHAKFVIQ
ncbi:MAG: hypothetical protein CVU11_08610 [Bacteroidetes bacterium HGW-Bacteroidetes-6]|jgi:hypothetical protein|nr:MAG: hypothetical protein CVU11_08610 [Bacteroidetes bacterium HGW-Bacteroidetes-6]